MDTDNESGFLRQRRNFLAICVFIVFYRLIELNLSEINILGNKATIKNPSMVSLSILIFWTYYLWRYTTAIEKVSGLEKFKIQYYNKYHYLLAKIGLKKLGINKHEAAYLAHGAETLGSMAALYKGGVGEIGIAGRLSHTEIRFKGTELIRSRAKALFAVVYNKHEFSEYVFPYILGIFAILELFHKPILTGTLKYLYKTTH